MTSRTGGGDQVTTNDSTHVASQNQNDASTRLSQEANSLFSPRSSQENRETERPGQQAANDNSQRGNERSSDSRGDNQTARGGDNRGDNGRDGQQQSDSKKTAQNDQFLDVPPIWDTRALAMSGATTRERPGATGADRGKPNADQKPAEQKPEQNPGEQKPGQKPGEPEPKPGEPIPGRAMRDGPVVQLTTRFGGTNQRPNHGSGFLVGPEGQQKEPIDGQRFIATAHHVVGENHANSDTRKIYETLGQDFANADGNGDKVLSKEEIGKKVGELESAPNKDKQNKEQSFQFKHLNDNFDQISKISKELNPSGPDGISEQGLKEYYKRNTDITVDTKRGTFKAELADVNDRSDTALLKMKLDPRVEKALGDNIPLARDFRQGEKIQAQGYPGVNSDSGLLKFYHQTDGKLRITGRDETGGRHISEMGKTFPGMSGGPTRNSKGEALGVNSADADLDGKNYLYTGPASDIREMLRKQKGR